MPPPGRQVYAGHGLTVARSRPGRRPAPADTVPPPPEPLADEAAPTRWTRPVALLLTFATGAAGLVYQVTWERYLATLLAPTARPSRRCWVCSLAAWRRLRDVRHLTRRRLAAAARRGEPPRLLALYGAVEAGIGLWALVFPWLFAARAQCRRGCRNCRRRRPSHRCGPGRGLLLPPTLLMGGTIPILTQGLARSMRTPPASMRWCTGSIPQVRCWRAAGGILADRGAGFSGTLRLMAAVNLLAVPGSGGWATTPACRRPAVISAEPVSTPAARPADVLRRRPPVGFRHDDAGDRRDPHRRVSLGSSEYTFGVVVAVFVACIAAGSLLVGALPRIPRGCFSRAKCYW